MARRAALREIERGSGRLRQSPHRLAHRRPASAQSQSGARPEGTLPGAAYLGLICDIPLRWSEIRQGDGCIRHLGAHRVSARRPLPPQLRPRHLRAPITFPLEVAGALLRLPPSLDANRFGNLAPGPILLTLEPAEVDGRHGERRVAHMTHSDASRKQHDDQIVRPKCHHLADQWSGSQGEASEATLESSSTGSA